MRALSCALLATLLACRDEASKVAPLVKGRSWVTPALTSEDGGVAAAKSPRVVFRGGRFLRNPRIVTVTFTRDDAALVARLEHFGDAITQSSWWHDVVDSYCSTPSDCIGEAKPGPHVRLADALPETLRESDLDDVLLRAAKAERFGKLDEESLLLVYLPKDVRLGDYCGAGPRAFHRALGEEKIAYAVLPRCGDDSELTSTASHELVEATTNPDPSNRGFAFEGGSKMLGFVAAGLEPVDPCGLLTMNDNRTLAGGFVVQRAWSNRAAAGGHDPCVPARSDRPYVALVPRVPTVRLESEGASTTITLDAVADRPVPKWAVSTIDLSGYERGTTFVEATLDKTIVQAGDTVTLTLTSRKSATTAIVGVVSSIGVVAHMWPVAVALR